MMNTEPNDMSTETASPNPNGTIAERLVWWRNNCDAAQARIAELEAERADLLCAAQWFESGRGRTRYFGNDDEMIVARMEQARNNERASEIIRRAALAGVEPAKE